jgi:hypothetical protein
MAILKIWVCVREDMRRGEGMSAMLAACMHGEGAGERTLTLADTYNLYVFHVYDSDIIHLKIDIPWILFIRMSCLQSKILK